MTTTGTGTPARGPSRRISPGVGAKMAADYAAGLSVRRVADKYDHSYGATYNALLRAGAQLRPPPHTNRQPTRWPPGHVRTPGSAAHRQVLDEYRHGLGIQRIADKHHYNYWTVRTVLLGAGVALRPAHGHGTTITNPGLARALVAGFAAGSSISALARQHGRSWQLVKRVLREAGLDTTNSRREWPVRELSLARLLADLDRCSHGRHEGDTCAGWSAARPDAGCPGGVSLGNPRLPTGVRLGTDYAARPIFMPPRGRRHDPAAWFEQPPTTVPDGAQPIELAEAARALGKPVALMEFWATQLGTTYLRWRDEVLVCEGGRVMGRQPVDAAGGRAGAYTLILHERNDPGGA